MTRSPAARRALRPLLLLGAIAVAACQTIVPEPPAAPGPAEPSAATARLLEDVRILAADDMAGRDAGSAGGAAARAYIVERLEAVGVEPPPFGRLQPFSAQGRTPEGPRRIEGVNIVGLIPGVGAGDRYIVVTAHYDHVGVSEGLIYNGADDNASGVATLLELAARLKAEPPQHSVLLVALDAEERGLLGAKHFVEAPPVPLESIVLNLDFDMLARAETDGRLWVTGTYQHPRLRPILEALPAAGPVSLAFGKDTPQDVGADNWVGASDHAAFHRAGVPFLYLGVDYHPDYHRPSDDFERIDPAVFGASAELAIAAFRALDRSLQP